MRSGGSQAGGPAPPLGPRSPLPFEVGGVLGRGGMGEVRTAFDRRLGRDVAIKMVVPGDAASAARLAHEAVLTARLEHPGIMPVYEAGRSEDGRPWYAMRLFSGRTLAEACAEGPGLRERLRLVRHVLDAAQAVAYAHGQGILHRDLKPENVLTGRFGETIVADWGLACPIEEAARGGTCGGTPGYASPEQAAGLPIDGRSDVYGLGAILRDVLDVPGGGLPADLRAIVERSLHPEPDRRYPSAAAFTDDLLAWFEGRRVAAHEYTPRELLGRLVRAWRVPLTVAAVGLAGVAVAATVGWRATVEERGRAEVSERAAAEARAQERRAFAAALRVQAQVAAERGLRMESEVLAANALLRDDSPEARGVLAASAGRPRWGRLDRRAMPDCPRRTISADGARAACVRDDGVRSIDLSGAGPDRVAPGRWARAGFVGGADHVVLVDATNQLWAWTADSPPVPLGVRGSPWAAHAFSPIPPQAVVQGIMSEIRLSFGTGGAVQSRSCLGTAVQAVALDRDGSMLVACDDRQIMRVPGGRFARIAEADGMVSLLQPLAEGRVFVGTITGNALLFDASGALLARHDLGDGAVFVADLHGDRIVASLTGGDAVVWDVPTDTLPMQFHGPRMEGVWLDDGRLRLLADEVEDRSAPAESRPHRFSLDSGIGALAFSPDGHLLAVGTGQGNVTLLDPASGRVRHRLHPDDSVVKDVTFSPDGDALLVASAGERQVMYAIPDGTLLREVRGFGARRGAWFRRAGPWLAPYGPGIWQLAPTATLRDEPGFQDLESNLSGTLGAALTGDDTLYLAEDGPAPRLTPIEAVAPSTGITIAGEELFASTDHELIRYARSGERTWQTTIPVGVTDLAAAPDGRWVALGMLDGTVDVYRVGTASPIARMTAHRGRVSALVFSADSRWLATGGWDEEVRTWSTTAFEADAASTAAEVERAWGRTLEEVLE